MDNGRGGAVREHIMNLIKIFKGEIPKILDSVQPILTRVKPKEETFNLENLKKSVSEIIQDTVIKCAGNTSQINSLEIDEINTLREMFPNMKELFAKLEKQSMNAPTLQDKIEVLTE